MPKKTIKIGILTAVLVFTCSMILTTSVFGDKKNIYRERAKAYLNDKSIIAANPDGTIPQKPDLAAKSSKTIDKSKAIKIENMKDYKKASEIVESKKGEFLFKGSLTYEEFVNKLEEYGIGGGFSPAVSPDKLLNAIILKCNTDYYDPDFGTVKKAYVVWAYNAETGARFCKKVLKGE